jgi:hypothetical protein
MDRSGEHLAVLVWKVPEIRQEARGPDVLHPSEPRSASSGRWLPAGEAKSLGDLEEFVR